VIKRSEYKEEINFLILYFLPDLQNFSLYHTFRKKREEKRWIRKVKKVMFDSPAQHFLPDLQNFSLYHTFGLLILKIGYTSMT